MSYGTKPLLEDMESASLREEVHKYKSRYAFLGGILTTLVVVAMVHTAAAIATPGPVVYTTASLPTQHGRSLALGVQTFQAHCDDLELTGTPADHPEFSNLKRCRDDEGNYQLDIENWNTLACANKCYTGTELAANRQTMRCTSPGPNGPWEAVGDAGDGASDICPWSSPSPIHTAALGMVPISAEFSQTRASNFCCATAGAATYHKTFFRCYYPNGNSGNGANPQYKLAPENAWIIFANGQYGKWWDGRAWVNTNLNSNYATYPGTC